MIGAGGVDAMFITDHLPELPGKSKESSTSQGPDNYAPLLLCELQIRLWRALPKDLAFLLPACLPHPSKEHPFIAFPVEAQANCSVWFPMQRLPLRASIIVRNVQQNASKDDILRPLFPAQL